MGSLRKYRVNKQDIFLIGWGLVLFYYLLIISSEIGLIFNPSYLRILFFVVVEFLWFVKIFKDKYKASAFCLFVIIAIAIGLPSVRMEREVILLFLTFALASKNVNIRTFVKFDLKLRLLFFIVLFLLSISNVINNFSAVINGSLKYAFGWQHPNTCASNMILILLEWLYLRWGKFKARHWLVSISVLLLLYIFVAARTSIYSYLIVIIWSMIICRKTNIDTKRRSYRIRAFLYTLIYPLSAALSYILVALYINGNSFCIKLNEIMSGRLFFSAKYLLEYGVSIFGQSIETVSSRQMILMGGGTHYSGLDMAFINMPIQYGVLFTIVFIAVYAFLCNRLYKLQCFRELSLVLFFGLVAIMSTASITFYRNFTIIFIWVVILHSNKNHIVLNEKGKD